MGGTGYNDNAVEPQESLQRALRKKKKKPRGALQAPRQAALPAPLGRRTAPARTAAKTSLPPHPGATLPAAGVSASAYDFAAAAADLQRLCTTTSGFVEPHDAPPLLRISPNPDFQTDSEGFPYDYFDPWKPYSCPGCKKKFKGVRRQWDHAKAKGCPKLARRESCSGIPHEVLSAATDQSSAGPVRAPGEGRAARIETPVPIGMRRNAGQSERATAGPMAEPERETGRRLTVVDAALPTRRAAEIECSRVAATVDRAAAKAKEAAGLIRKEARWIAAATANCATVRAEEEAAKQHAGAEKAAAAPRGRPKGKNHRAGPQFAR
jgi:hypothetical protein